MVYVRSHSFEIWQDIVPVPGRIRATQLGPSIVLGPGPAHRYHAVDGGASTNAATKSNSLLAAVQLGLGDRCDIVVDAWIVEVAASTCLYDFIRD